MNIIKLQNKSPNGLNMISLFAGGGGSSLGYKSAGYDMKLSVEWDEEAAGVYRDNFPDTPIYQGDIGNLSINEATKLSGVSPGELDVLDGSPPCQGFSLAGKRDFTDDRNQLFREYIRILKGFMPRAFIMENVAGLRKGKMKIIFAEMTKALKDSGYRVVCRELNAWWYGVPQTRTRLIWIGIREDLPFIPSHPLPIMRRPVSFGQAVPGSNDRQLQSAVFKKSNSWRSITKPSPTLLASNSPDIKTITPDGTEVRKYNLKEAKAIQSFPEDFRINLKYPFKPIGNSVPPLMAEAIGLHLAGILND